MTLKFCTTLVITGTMPLNYNMPVNTVQARNMNVHLSMVCIVFPFYILL